MGDLKQIITEQENENKSKETKQRTTTTIKTLCLLEYLLLNFNSEWKRTKRKVDKPWKRKEIFYIITKADEEEEEEEDEKMRNVAK